MIDIPPEVKAYRDLHFPSRADTNAVIDSLLARLESEHDRAEDLLADKDEMLDALGHMIEDTPAEEIRRLKAILHDTQEAWLYERGKREKLERYWTCPRDVDLTAEDVWAVADVTVNALEDDSENWWLLYEQEKHGRDYWMSCAQKAEAEVSEMRERLAAGHKESDRRGERIEELEAALAHERDCRAAIVAEYGKRGPSAS